MSSTTLRNFFWLMRHFRTYAWIPRKTFSDFQQLSANSPSDIGVVSVVPANSDFVKWILTLVTATSEQCLHYDLAEAHTQTFFFVNFHCVIRWTCGLCFRYNHNSMAALCYYSNNWREWTANKGSRTVVTPGSEIHLRQNFYHMIQHPSHGAAPTKTLTVVLGVDS